MGNESIRYLIVPGWQGSSDDHWQTYWQNSLPNGARVEQADWLTPRREDWIAALAEAIAADVHQRRDVHLAQHFVIVLG